MLAAQLFEALQREEQVCATLGGHHSMDFIEDDRLDALQNDTCASRELDIKRLWGCDQHVRGFFEHASTLA